MTPQECEAILGARGSLRVVTAGEKANRDVARKWLVANGIGASFACALAAKAIEAAYNDTTDGELKGLMRREEQGKALFGSETPTIETAPTPTPTPETAGTVEQAIRDLIERTTPKAPPLDENRVREIVKEEAKSFESPTVTIEIKTEHASKTLPEALRHYQFEHALRVIAAGVPLALVGAAGGGKSTMGMQIASALELQCYIQGAIASAHELTGFVDGYGKYHRTPCRDATEHGGVLCLDDFDASTDNAAPLVMQALLANGHMTFPDSTKPIAKHAMFRCIMSMNTFGTGADRQYVGRTQLDAAMLDRFYFLNLQYDENLERIAAGGSARKRSTETFATTPACTADEWIDRVQRIRGAIPADKSTRMVVSPRASIYGVKLIAAGLSVDQCEEGLIWKGLDKDAKTRIRSKAGL